MMPMYGFSCVSDSRRRVSVRYRCFCLCFTRMRGWFLGSNPFGSFQKMNVFYNWFPCGPNLFLLSFGTSAYLSIAADKCIKT